MKHVQPSQGQIDSARRRLYAYIFPNNPCTASQVAAFNEAVILQAEHDAAREEEGLPSGVNSFSIGHFSMTVDADQNTDNLNRKTICPEAYAVLLREGLLYRGVERVWP